MIAVPTTSPLGPTLETERLLLRPPVAEDFTGYCAFHADSESMKYLGGVQSPSVVWRTMRSAVGSWQLDGFSMFSVLDKATGEWIGRTGPIYPHGWPGREVGWGFLSAHWGKGYAKEAAIVTIDFAFDRLSWDKVIHTINPKNEGSIALAMRLGSYNQGPGQLPDPFASEVVDIWGQTREEWLANKMALG